MSVTIKTCITIAAAPAAVWAAVEDVESHVDWMRDAETVTFRTEHRAGVGAEFDCLTRVGPLHTNDHFVITTWEPGVALGIVHRGAVTGTGEFRLTPEQDGSVTHFCWEERLTFPWWLGARIGEQCGRPVLRRIWAGNLRRLRARIEQAHIPPPSG